MTNTELEAIYKANVDISHITALRAVFSHGFYAGAGQTPNASSVDKSDVSAPTAIIRYRSVTSGK